jgi:hypothetical protein
MLGDAVGFDPPPGRIASSGNVPERHIGEDLKDRMGRPGRLQRM